MPRIPRSRLGKGVFHVLNRAHDRRLVFKNDADKQILLKLLVTHRRKFHLNIYHWVIMGNHFHLAIEALKVEDLSRFIGKVCELYSRYWRKTHGGAGTLWQGRFKSMAVQKEGYLSKLGRYMERNPVAAGLCDIPWDYSWSSAKAYVNGVDDKLVKVDDLYSYVTNGESPKERATSYRRYLLSERELWESEAKLFGNDNRAVGDEQFILQTIRKAGRLSPRRTGPKKRKTIRISV